MELTKERLEEILKSGDFDALIGHAETEWFECKSQPYSTDTEGAKRELAKDASSFANASGGKIFIGLKTEPSDTHFGDEVVKVVSLAPGVVNATQYRDLIATWIYPQIDGIEVKWHQLKSDPTQGVVVIHIPPQKDAVKPFLFVKPMDGGKGSGIVFGYAERRGDSSKPLSIVDLQTALRSGFNFEKQLRERLDGIETLLRTSAEQSSAVEEKKTSSDTLAKRIEYALSHGGIAQNRNIVISAVPKPKGLLKTVFLGTEDSLKRRLENPPRLRWGGWDLTHHDQAKILPGGLIRVTNGDTKLVDLYRDGTMIFSALADNNFLAWGRNDEKDQRINSLALIEIIYSFLAFYAIVLDDFSVKPKEVELHIELNNMHLGNNKSYLLPYHLESGAQMFSVDRHDSPENNGRVDITVPAEGFKPIAITYQLAQEIYLWFGLGEDKIPYMKDEGGVRVFDTSPISKI